MIPSRTVIVSLAVLWLVFLSIYQIPVIQSLLGDPPSLYNKGDGGVSEFVSQFSIYRRVKAIRDSRDLWQYDPRTSLLLVAGLDKFLDYSEISEVMDWVARGGYLVVMDEYPTPGPLLTRLNISLGAAVTEITLGNCTVGSATFSVLFNVYREVLGGRPICWANGLSVAVELSVGRGRIVIVGDSSIAINEVLRSGYRATQIAFLLALMNRETIVFYEGGRVATEIALSPRSLIALFYYLSKFISYVVYSGAPYGIVGVIIVSVLVITAVFPRPRIGIRRFSESRKAPLKKLDILFRESVRAWMEWVDRLGK